MSTVDVLIRLLLVILFFTLVSIIFSAVFRNGGSAPIAIDDQAKERAWNRHVHQALFVSRPSK